MILILQGGAHQTYTRSECLLLDQADARSSCTFDVRHPVSCLRLKKVTHSGLCEIMRSLMIRVEGKWMQQPNPRKREKERERERGSNYKQDS